MEKIDQLSLPDALADFEEVPRSFTPWKLIYGKWYQGEVNSKGQCDGRGITLTQASDATIAYY